ncbi:hypothetical protein, partial [Phaeodactylibacter luteus]|uniref:hypothetical protein n=1 Tax=Phaeodactylibacter luteus TaxID=1564516 RepID=UPI001B86B928
KSYLLKPAFALSVKDQLERRWAIERPSILPVSVAPLKNRMCKFFNSNFRKYSSDVLALLAQTNMAAAPTSLPKHSAA